MIPGRYKFDSTHLLHLPAEKYEMFFRKPNLGNGHVACVGECSRNICLFFPVSNISGKFGSYSLLFDMNFFYVLSLFYSLFYSFCHCILVLMK